MTDLRTPPLNDGDLFSERVRQYAHDRPLRPVHILEAGCGWGRGLDLGDCERRVTGVDMDAPALRAHTADRTDLDEWHLGDLRTVPMPPRAYDVVHASFLIERVPHAELVLDRFVAALKPGGLLLVRLRDRNTAFGFLDRRLPRWLRDPLWRHLARRGRVELLLRPEASPGAMRSAPQAGGPREAVFPAAGASGDGADGTAEGREGRRARRRAGDERAARIGVPPPAVYEKVASRQGMRWYCVMRGLVIAEEYTSRASLDALGAGSGLVGGLCQLVASLSRGRLTAEHSEVTLVIRKPENRFARVI
ncbi:class I SAM-dependent methyltransferase [Actinomadura keratinilytica]|uniref:class I SAM-dependent methyltransferase n=1 Tax=Actinomadura keratinilytica TaxID=547461 RepID=UPI0036116587